MSDEIVNGKLTMMKGKELISATLSGLCFIVILLGVGLFSRSLILTAITEGINQSCLCPLKDQEK